MKKTVKILLMTILFIGIISLFAKVNAATATISSNNTNPTVGDNVTITVKITAAAWSLSVDGTGVTSTKYADTTDDAKNTTITKTLSLDTNSSGTKKISLTGTVSDGDTDVTSKINTSVTVNVKEKPATKVETTKPATQTPTTQKEPEKATISSVVVNGITIKQDLKVTNKETVSVKVNTSNKEDATIYNNLTKKSYTAKSGSAVSVQVVEGTNTLTISLSNGTKTTRKIYSQKEEEVKANTIEEEEEKILLKSIKIDGFKLTPEFSNEVYEYNITIPEEQNELTKLNIEAIGAKEEYKVEITGNENFVDGENIITITVKSKDGKKISTYKIKVNKEPKTIETVVEPVLEEFEPKQQMETPNTNNKLKWIVVMFAGLVATLGIIFGIIEYSYGKKHDGDEEISFADVGFQGEKEDKEDVLEDLKENKEDDEEEQKETTRRRGKHF